MQNEIETITAHELFCRPDEPIRWLIEEMLAPGLYLLGGAPKVGKSWLSLQMAVAMCSGTPFLGRQTEKCGVLYLCLEDSARRVRARARKFGASAPDNLFFGLTASAMDERFVAQIEAFLAMQPQVQLIIIDTLQKIRGVPKSGSAYANDYREMAALKQLADAHGVCILAVHHLRKAVDDDPMNRLSGTTGLTGCADGTWVLMRDNRADGCAQLYMTGRDVEDQELSLEFVDCKWWMAESFSTGDFGKDSLLCAIVSFLQEVKEFEGTATQLAEQIQMSAGLVLTPSALSKHLRKYRQKLLEAGVTVLLSRTADCRTLRLTYDTSDGNDTDDGSFCKAEGMVGKTSVSPVTGVIPVMPSLNLTQEGA